MEISKQLKILILIYNNRRVRLNQFEVFLSLFTLSFLPHIPFIFHALISKVYKAKFHCISKEKIFIQLFFGKFWARGKDKIL